FTATAYDVFGNVTTGYRGTVHVTSSDGQATLPPDFTFTATDAGVHNFSATLQTAGTQSITTTDTANSSITGTGLVQVNAAPATHLGLTGYPAAPAGTGGFVLVQALDPFGNVDPNYTGTVHLTSTDPQPYLDPDYQFGAQDGGQHYFFAVLYTAG